MVARYLSEVLGASFWFFKFSSGNLDHLKIVHTQSLPKWGNHVSDKLGSLGLLETRFLHIGKQLV